MSVGTAAMFNNNNHHHAMGAFKATHARSRSYNELLNKFKQQITTETTRFRVRKRSHSELLDNELTPSNDLTSDENPNKRSRTAPPQSPSQNESSPSPENKLESTNSTPSLSSTSTFKLSSKSPNVRSRSLSPNKSNKIKSSERNSIDNGVMAHEHKVHDYEEFSHESQPQHQFDEALNQPKGKIIPHQSTIEDSSKGLKNLNNSQFGSTSKSDITLPSISSVLSNDIKQITPTTSLDYFDTYKPNDENWRYGLLDTINKTNTNKTLISKDSQKTESKPVFNSKISKPVLPPIKLESERKINFPYESNYTYLNKTYLNDVEKYPEYLELAQSLVQLSRSDNVPTIPPINPISVPVNSSPIASADNLSSPKNYSNNFPPLYPYQLQSAQPPPPQQQQQPQQQQHIQHVQSAAQSAPTSNVNIPYQSNYQPYYSQYQPYQAYMTSPSNTVYTFPPAYASYVSEQPATPPKKHTKFIPITPPSSKINKSKNSDGIKTSPKNHPPRMCISCGSDQSPCWRPSWSSKEGQLCNSCGLRYKKTSARCLNNDCKKIPAKGEWSLMLNKGLHKFNDGEECYSCLECGYKVEVKS